MRLTALLCLSFIFFLTPSITHADEKEQQVEEKEEEKGYWSIGFILGGADVSINADHTISQREESLMSFSSGAELNYYWPNNFLLESSYIASNDLDIFGFGDDYKLQQLNVLLGYKFALSDSVTFTPKVGFSQWDLDTKEGFFLNPGAEERASFDGGDATYEFEFEFFFAEDLSFTLGYENTSYDFGEIAITSFGMSFDL